MGYRPCSDERPEANNVCDDRLEDGLKARSRLSFAGLAARLRSNPVTRRMRQSPRQADAGSTGSQSNAKGPPRLCGMAFSGLKSCRVGLLERRDGAGLVVVNVENGVELGQLQQVVNLLGQLEQFKDRALVLGSGVSAHQFAQT